MKTTCTLLDLKFLVIASFLTKKLAAVVAGSHTPITSVQSPAVNTMTVFGAPPTSHVLSVTQTVRVKVSKAVKAQRCLKVLVAENAKVASLTGTSTSVRLISPK